MLGIAIRKSALEKLITKGLVKVERIGDSETGRVYVKFKDRTFYYRQAKFNKEFWIRDSLY
jgi:hypothetical protein